LPKKLLKRIDARAKALGVSRNCFIVSALSEKVEAHEEWPKNFVAALKRKIGKAVRAGADEFTNHRIDAGYKLFRSA
jgi:metal-responsive CopG/Arc/MetJ family transcriptional regulator